MTPDLPIWIPVLCLGLGTLLVLRAAILVTTKSNGRFRGDPWASITVGFGLILLGQFLLRR